MQIFWACEAKDKKLWDLPIEKWATRGFRRDASDRGHDQDLKFEGRLGTNFKIERMCCKLAKMCNSSMNKIGDATTYRELSVTASG